MRTYIVLCCIDVCHAAPFRVKLVETWCLKCDCVEVKPVLFGGCGWGGGWSYEVPLFNVCFHECGVLIHLRCFWISGGWTLGKRGAFLPV